MRTLTDENAADNTSMRDFYIDLPKGATVWITTLDGHIEPITATAIKVEMPDANTVC